MSGRAERQEAEVDDVFRLVAVDGTSRLLKIAVPGRTRVRDPEVLSLRAASLQTGLLLHLATAAPQLPVQRVVPALDGRPEVWLTDAGQPQLVRLTSWLDGDLLAQADSTAALRREVGATLARYGEVRGWLAGYLDRFDSVVRPRLAGVATQVGHTDFHGENLLSDGGRVTGILDFGDALAGPVAMDVGIAACYQLGEAGDVLAPALDVVAGYHAVDPLSDADLELAGEFIVGRVVTRIIVSQWSAAREPSNRGYLLRRTPLAIEQLAALRLLTPEKIADRVRAVRPDALVRWDSD